MKKKALHHNEDIKRFNPSIEQGLDDESVNYMVSVGKVNIAKNPTNKSYTRIILGNVFTFFNILMFAIAGLLLLMVGPKVATNLMFLGIIVCNLLIGTIQECKSKHTIEKLKLLNDSKIKVKRNGNDVELLPSEIVLDDVVMLSAGDQIPADCKVLGTDVIEVNESLLTGESVPVKKSQGDMVYAGSFVVAGSIAVQVDKVGNDTYLQSLENRAKASKQPKSRLMIAISKIIRNMTIIALPLAVIVAVYEFVYGVNMHHFQGRHRRGLLHPGSAGRVPGHQPGPDARRRHGDLDPRFHLCGRRDLAPHAFPSAQRWRVRDHG